MSNPEDRESDVFDQFKDAAVGQMASFAQLVAEARRLGLIPELPRELVEKMDLGGTLMDVLRLNLKHATAMATLVGPQGRNLEKLNHLSAILAKGKSGPPKTIEGESSKVDTVFELPIDNPVDRPQAVSVSMGRLHQLDGAETQDFKDPVWPKPNDASSSEDGNVEWRLASPIVRLEPHELRALRIVVPNEDLKGEYETTVVVRLTPLGSFQRYRLCWTVAAAATKRKRR